jgi:hypothetical protein
VPTATQGCSGAASKPYSGEGASHVGLCEEAQSGAPNRFGLRRWMQRLTEREPSEHLIQVFPNPKYISRSSYTKTRDICPLVCNSRGYQGQRVF